MRMPTIFIGCGGAGREVLEIILNKINNKLKLEGIEKEERDQIFENVFQFIWIETHGLGREGWKAGKYINIGGFNGTRFVETEREFNEFFNKWWFPKYDSIDLSDGCGTIRPNGKLCVWKHVGDLFDIISVALNRARDVMKKEGLGDSKLNIFIVTSTSGGSGSGMFFDIALISRHLAEEKGFQFKLNGIVITPEILDLFVRFEERRHRIYTNAYFFLRELNFFQFRFDKNEFQAKYIMEYPNKRTGVLKPDQQLFDMVYLYQNCNEKGKIVNEKIKAYTIIADTLYHWIASPASAGYVSERIFDNYTHTADNARYGMHPKTKEKRACIFGSSGTMSIVLPIDNIVNHLKAFSAKEIISKFYLDETDINYYDPVKNFLAYHFDIRINALLQNIKNKVNLPQISWDDLETKKAKDKDGIREEKNRIIKLIENIIARNDKKINETCKIEVENFKEIFDEFLKELKVGRKKYIFQKAIIREILKIVWEQKNMIEPEETDQISEIEKYNLIIKKQEEFLKDIIDETKSRKVNKEVVKEKLENIYKASINKTILYSLKENFYMNIINFLESYKMCTDLLDRILENLVVDYQDELEESLIIQSDEAGITHFIWDRNLCEDYINQNKLYGKMTNSVVHDDLTLAVINKHIDEKLKFLKEKIMIEQINPTRIRDSLEAIMQDVQFRINDAILKDEDLKQVKNITIWDGFEFKFNILREDDLKSKIREYIQNKMNSSYVWLAWDEEMNEKLVGEGKQTLYILIYSDEAFREKFKGHEEIKNAFPIEHTGKLDFVKGGENFSKHCLQCIKIRTGIVLNTINSIQKYIESAEQLQERSAIPSFSDYRFEKELAQYCPELPFTEEGEQINFVLAEWFGLEGNSVVPLEMKVEIRDEFSAKKRKIIKVTWDERAFMKGNNQGYYMWRDGEGNKGGCKGRLYAAKEFLQQKKVVDEIRKKIRSYWNKKLNTNQQKEFLEKIKATLDKWYEHTVHKDLKHILNLQRIAIREKLESGNFKI